MIVPQQALRQSKTEEEVLELDNYLGWKGHLRPLSSAVNLTLPRPPLC